ncbi:MAG TPA: HdeD family acid-resistance protein [Polyangiaceae bacterium]|nr:HdeD family acid-resistance protein [Polyangiaceae bacterium]
MNARAEAVRSIESTPKHLGWLLALRGVLAVIFGAIALRSPGAAAAAFVVVFAIYAFADGIVDFALAARLGRSGQRWGWYLFEGLATIAIGIVALAYPGLTMLALVLLVAVRAIAVGIFELVGASSADGPFYSRDHESRWLLGITGALSIVLGILLLGSPVAGAFALVWTVGVYAIIYGVMLFAFGLRVLSTVHRTEREVEQMRGPAATAH